MSGKETLLNIAENQQYVSKECWCVCYGFSNKKWECSTPELTILFLNEQVQQKEIISV